MFVAPAILAAVFVEICLVVLNLVIVGTALSAFAEALCLDAQLEVHDRRELLLVTPHEGEPRFDILKAVRELVARVLPLLPLSDRCQDHVSHGTVTAFFHVFRHAGRRSRVRSARLVACGAPVSLPVCIDEIFQRFRSVQTKSGAEFRV